MARSSHPDELQEIINRGPAAVGLTIADAPAAGVASAPETIEEIPDAQFRVERQEPAPAQLQEGVLLADSRDAAVATLRRQQIQVTSIRSRAARSRSCRASRCGVAAQAARDLHPPVLGHARRRPAAGAVPRDPRRARRSNRHFQAIIQQVRIDVESGASLADAMRKHPKAFDDLYVNMIAAGEAGGILDIILQRLSTYIEKVGQAEQRRSSRR